MATHTALEVRKTIREAIGTTWWNEEEGDLWTVNVADNNNDTVRIPLRLDEEVKTVSLDELPYLSMRMVHTTYTPHNIAATVRKRETWIDVHLFYTDTDNIDRTVFPTTVRNKIQDLVRDYQCTFASDHNYFVNVGEERYIPEEKAHQVVYHWVFEIYVIHYDCCE